MKFPIKLNKTFWPKIICQVLPSIFDPRLICSSSLDSRKFSKAVSAFKFGTTFKSTKYNRYPLMLNKISKLKLPNNITILDVGASDGNASLRSIKELNFQKYYITDLNINTWYSQNGNNCYFYNDDKKCILIANKYFIIYPQEFSSKIFKKVLWKIFPFLLNRLCEKKRIKLINPLLKDNKKIKIIKYDIFQKWDYEKIDLVIAANILNESYFSINDLNLAIKNLIKCLSQNGILVVIDNRKIEKGSIFQVIDDKLKFIDRINGGTEIEKNMFIFLEQKV